MLLTRRQSDLLLPEIDTDPPGALRGLDLSREAVDNRLVDDDRQDSVLKAVSEENVAEARPDESANAQFLQRPHRSFARRAATKIRPGDKDFRLPIRLPVQDEFRILRPIRQIAQRAE